jgi:hypothetical protein
LSVVLLAWFSALWILRICARRPGAILRGLRLTIPPFAVGLGLRILAPWGPHTASGRDLAYIDPVLMGDPGPHTQLMAAFYSFLGNLADPLSGLVWGQVVVGALCCSLVALLTYQLCRRELPSVAAGLLAAILVVLIRVDAGPAAPVTLRFVLLATAILAVSYSRSGSKLTLAATVCGAIALAYGRLETVLFTGLVLTWLVVAGRAQDVKGTPHSERPRLLALGIVLGVTMFASLVHRWLLLPSALAIAWLTLRRVAGQWPRRDVMIAGVVTLVALLPRAVEVLSLERVTSTRFPAVFLILLGKENILLFDPALCTPAVILLAALGTWHLRTELTLRTYLVCLALPILLLYLLFMGDTTARMKLQGLSILLVLPVAGLGAEWLILRLHAWRGTRLAWSLGLGLVVATTTLGMGHGRLTSVTTLQAEYRFLSSLHKRLPPGSELHVLAFNETLTNLEIPRALTQRARVRLKIIDGAHPPPLPSGSLVFLGAGCHRFRDGEPLPGPQRDLLDLARNHRAWPYWKRLLFLAWDKRGTLQQVFDQYPISERPLCTRLKRQLGLVPYSTEVATRSPLEGRYMPARITFGIYRVTAGQ